MQVLTGKLFGVVGEVTISAAMAILRQVEPAQLSTDCRWLVRLGALERLLLIVAVLLENSGLLGVKRLIAALHLPRLTELHLAFLLALLVLALDGQVCVVDYITEASKMGAFGCAYVFGA